MYIQSLLLLYNFTDFSIKAAVDNEQINECGYAPMQFYLWTPKFGFYIIFSYHKIFSWLVTTIKKYKLFWVSELNKNWWQARFGSWGIFANTWHWWVDEWWAIYWGRKSRDRNNLLVRCVEVHRTGIISSFK